MKTIKKALRWYWINREVIIVISVAIILLLTVLSGIELLINQI